MRNVLYEGRFRKSINNLSLFSLLFCYVFAFYIGPLSVSLLIALPLYFYALLSNSFVKEIKFVISTLLFRRCIQVWFVICFIGLLFPTLFLTLDYSFLRVVGMQGVHFIAAVPFLGYLRFAKIGYETTERYFIYIFLLQTIIQLIVVNSDYLGEMILYFNHFEPDKVQGIGSGIRGKALSAATTYHLTMAYGFCFIIYLMRYVRDKVSFKVLLIGALIFVGIFFAGRSGFVACLIGTIALVFDRHLSLKYRLIIVFKSIFYLAIILTITILLLSTFSPSFWALLNEQILPYAFEFLYSIDNTGEFETASTTHLLSMWEDTDFNYLELVFGSGKYSNEDGSYYMHVDPGILRHLLFMGIIGYLLLIFYQLQLFPIWKMKGITKYYYSMIFLFLLVMDFKGINIGLNKFAFAITLLLSFSYFYLEHRESNSETDEKNTVSVRY